MTEFIVIIFSLKSLEMNSNGYKSIEEADEQTGKSAESPTHYNLRNIILGHMFLVLTLLSFSCASISVQMALSTNNIFAMNSIRFSIQTIVVVLIGLCLKHSFKVKRAYWWHAFGAVVLHTMYGILMYLALSFMPIGNSDALFTAFYAVCSTLIDICRKVINKVAVMTTFMAVIGIMFLIQPWDLENIDGTYQRPCTQLGSIQEIWINNNTNYSKTVMTTFNDATPISVKYQLIGYTMILITGISVAGYSNLIKSLLSEHPFTVPNFLFGLFGSVVSFFINFVQKQITMQPLYHVSDGGICVLFLCTFTVGTLTGNLFEALALKYIHVSEIAISGSVLTVLYYIIQRTLLSEFHPGHANTIEIIGIVIIIVSNIVNTVNRFIGTGD